MNLVYNAMHCYRTTPFSFPDLHALIDRFLFTTPFTFHFSPLSSPHITKHHSLSATTTNTAAAAKGYNLTVAGTPARISLIRNGGLVVDWLFIWSKISNGDGGFHGLLDHSAACFAPASSSAGDPVVSSCGAFGPCFILGFRSYLCSPVFWLRILESCMIIVPCV